MSCVLYNSEVMESRTESSRITFDNEEVFRSAQSLDSQKSNKLALWVIKNSGGSIKNETQANYVLIVFIVVSVAAALFFVLTGSQSKAKLIAPPGQYILYSENEPPRLQANP